MWLKTVILHLLSFWVSELGFKICLHGSLAVLGSYGDCFLENPRFELWSSPLSTNLTRSGVLYQVETGSFTIGEPFNAAPLKTQDKILTPRPNYLQHGIHELQSPEEIPHQRNYTATSYTSRSPYYRCETKSSPTFFSVSSAVWDSAALLPWSPLPRKFNLTVHPDVLCPSNTRVPQQPVKYTQCVHGVCYV